METKTDPSSFSSAEDLEEAIRRRAEEIYLRSGKLPGHDLENWALAEREVRAEISATPARRAVIVKLNGIRYVGEYSLASADDYQPGEFGGGASVPIRFEGDKMFLRRPNGKELETRVVKKIG